MSRNLGRCLRSAFARLGAAGLPALAAGLALAPSMSGVAMAANSDPQGMIMGAGGRCIGPAGGSTSPAYAVDVNGGSGDWQIAWQARDENTLWFYGNNFFTPAVGAQTTDWGVVMGGDTSPALPSLVATPLTICCVVGTFGEKNKSG
jgi:hypothetical protein